MPMMSLHAPLAPDFAPIRTLLGPLPPLWGESRRRPLAPFPTSTTALPAVPESPVRRALLLALPALAAAVVSTAGPVSAPAWALSHLCTHRLRVAPVLQASAEQAFPFLKRAGDRGPLAVEESALVELRLKEEAEAKERLEKLYIQSERSHIPVALVLRLHC